MMNLNPKVKAFVTMGAIVVGFYLVGKQIEKKGIEHMDRLVEGLDGEMEIMETEE